MAIGWGPICAHIYLIFKPIDLLNELMYELIIMFKSSHEKYAVVVYIVT